MIDKINGVIKKIQTISKILSYVGKVVGHLADCFRTFPLYED